MDRRNFLKTIGLSAIYLVAPGTLQSRRTKDSISETIEGKTNYIRLPERDTPCSTAEKIEINNKQYGVLHTLNNNTKAMQITANQSPKLYNMQANSSIPNIPAIEKNIIDKGRETGKQRKIGFIFSGPTIEDNLKVTGLSFDNGIQTGEFATYQEYIKSKRGVGIYYITGKKIHITSQAELTEAEFNSLQQKQADIQSMVSLKRNGTYHKNFREYDHGRYIVEMSDGSQGILFIKGNQNGILKSILSDDRYTRVLQCDIIGDQGQMSGYYINNNGKLIYSNANKNHDVQFGEQGVQPILGNQPTLLILFTEK